MVFEFLGQKEGERNMEKNREEGKEYKIKKMEKMETLLSPYLSRFLPLTFGKVN